MPARHCCCCLPLRFGVFVISLVQFLGDGLLAALLWLVIDKQSGKFTQHVRIAAIVAAVYYSVLALSAFIAWIGVFARSRRALSQYSFFLYIAIVLNVALDIWVAVAIFKTNKQDLIDDCINGATNQNTIDYCNDFYNSKWRLPVYIASMVVAILIQCWAAYIVSSYAQKLEDEHSWGATVPLNTGYKYQAAEGRGSMEALTAPNYAPTYPYSDTQNSFGNSSVPYDPHQKV